MSRDYSVERVDLPNGIHLDVAMAGPKDAPPVILLHGFPESHRTWRNQLAALSGQFRLIAPDQRGYAGSSRPEGVEAYRIELLIEDIIGLADSLGLGHFHLVGHDWGGAVAWSVALRHPDRISRLGIVNAPHPLIFQRTLIEDAAQREASQYIRAFRDPGFVPMVEGMGLRKFFEASFMKHTDFSKIGDEVEVYLEQWGRPGALTAMLNWYRASEIIVPEPGEKVDLPPFFDAPFPKLSMPVLVVWGLGDSALLPVQLEGLDALVEDLTVKRLGGVGHFAPWEAPEAVSETLAEFFNAHPA